jgi:two-component system, sensor histidine kinase and response regulator
VNDQVSVALEAIRSGADDYLIKDENIQETVLHSVSRTLEKHHLKQENILLLKDLEAKNRELEKSNRELIQLNQQKNKFLGIAAHDVRGPVGGIIGLSDMLLDSGLGELTEDQSECLTIIHNTSKDILTLIDELLDVSVIESGKLDINLQSGSLQALIEERIKLMKNAADRKQIDIRSDLDDVPFFYFAPNRIAQVFDNLMTNAVKFSPWEARIHVRMEIHDDQAVVSVQDEGPGISETDQNKLFGTFQRLSAQPTGGEKSTGLGLAIVKKIIDAHQGQIGVRSAPGEGSTFFFSIPMTLKAV